MQEPARILVVDDEANLRSSLETLLVQEGYRVEAAESGEAALERISIQLFDLALIDLKLPGVGGMEVLATLRQQSPKTVIIVLTAYASLETAIEALRHGAHDYLFKPCKPAELRESVRRGLLNRQSQTRRDNLLRQLEELSGNLDKIRTTLIEEQEKPLPTIVQPTTGQERFLQVGELTVDRLRNIITLAGHMLDLTPTEYDLLAYLISQAPRVVPPQELVREVRGYNSELWEARDTLRSHIYHIRQAIKKATGQTNIIRTVRGVGYAIGK